MDRLPFPAVTREQFDTEYRERHLVHQSLDHWAERNPGGMAIRNATRGNGLRWSELRDASVQLASGLVRIGFRKGDVLAASLPLSNEHVILEYACFRIGVIHAPLDLRLHPDEVTRCLALIGARGFAFPGAMPGTSVRALAELVRERCDSVEHFIQVSQPGECPPGAIRFSDLTGGGGISPDRQAELCEDDAAQIIFTTGSTGSPKAALLPHRGITCQNLCLASAFYFRPDDKILCNLPASHVGGQAELLLTTLFAGGTAVTLETFDPIQSLDAIEKFGVTLVGQIPAMFQMEWRTSGYTGRNFSSLRAAVYGGQSVPPPFLVRMLEMAPAIGTGLGLTETCGFCSYTALSRDPSGISRSLGWAMPVYPISIREPMEGPGRAGRELKPGSIGHVCFQGPQTFLQYFNDPDATAASISSDGWLYTGDMGSADEYGLHFAGRATWVLKPAGYQVFPGDVEAHLSQLADRVANVGVVGHEHRLWSEGIIAFVEKRPGVEITAAELRRHARALTSYMRPLHYVIVESGAMPLNRSAKVDIVRLKELAKIEVARLRERGRWDAASSSEE